MEYELKQLTKAKYRGPYKKFFKKRALGRLKKILKLERYEIIIGLKDMSEVTRTLGHYLSKLNIDIIKELEKVK
ncbi:hypothetical protein JZ968_05140 [Riemerella anatipestifer]